MQMNNRKSHKILAGALACLFAIVAPLFSEDSLPSGYAGVSLGMSLDAAKQALKRDPQFGYRGDRDVSLLPGDSRILIETDTSITAPHSFLDRCYFQFYDEKLYIITINLRQDKVDHYSVFSSLCKKYGNPVSLNPQKSEWRNDSVIMTLERPLTIKYTDRAVFESLVDQSLVEKTGREKNTERFLDGL